MSKDQYHDEGPARKYWIQLPNMIDDSDLDVYEFRLYAHYKRVAGDDGKCWQSKATVATLCGMSTGKASEASRALEARGLITIEEVPSGRGQPYHIIRIVDVWPRNMALYAQRSQGEAISSPHELISSPGEVISSPGEIKKNPLRKTQEEETRDFLQQTKKPDRERIQNVLLDILRNGMPITSTQQERTWSDAIDTLTLEFKELHGYARKQPLDHNLTSKILAAIQTAYAEKGNDWPFKGNRTPNTPIIDAIVSAGLIGSNGQTAIEDGEAREAAARAKMHELAREHGHE